MDQNHSLQAGADDYDDIDAHFPDSSYVLDAVRMRNELLLRSQQAPMPIFYYCAQDGKAKCEKIIKMSLKMQPEPLNYYDWKILRSIPQSFTWRTPAEEQRRRMEKAKLDLSPSTEFSEELTRQLSAIVSLAPGIRSLNFEFVEPQDAGLDVVLFGGTFKINGHWKSFDFCHSSAKWCEGYLSRDNENKFGEEIFFCNHTVLDLYHAFVKEMAKVSRTIPYFISKEQNLLRATTRLYKLPRAVKITSTDKSNELLVSWDLCYADPQLYQMLNFVVILHQYESCRARRNDLIYREGSVMKCRCPVHMVPAKAGGTLFQNLNLAYRYFPMVAASVKEQDTAIFAKPPAAVVPAISGRESVDPDMYQSLPAKWLDLPERALPSRTVTKRSSKQTEDRTVERDSPDDVSVASYETYLSDSLSGCSLEEPSDRDRRENHITSNPDFPMPNTGRMQSILKSPALSSSTGREPSGTGSRKRRYDEITTKRTRKKVRWAVNLNSHKSNRLVGQEPPLPLSDVGPTAAKHKALGENRKRVRKVEAEPNDMKKVHIV